jgi:hypothetical protein
MMSLIWTLMVWFPWEAEVYQQWQDQPHNPCISMWVPFQGITSMLFLTKFTVWYSYCYGCGAYYRNQPSSSRGVMIPQGQICTQGFSGASSLLNWIRPIIGHCNVKLTPYIATENLVVAFYLRSIKLMIAAKSLKIFGKGHIASLTCTVELIFADFPIVVTRSVGTPRKIGSQ